MVTLFKFHSYRISYMWHAVAVHLLLNAPIFAHKMFDILPALND